MPRGLHGSHRHMGPGHEEPVTCLAKIPRSSYFKTRTVLGRSTSPEEVSKVRVEGEIRRTARRTPPTLASVATTEDPRADQTSTDAWREELYEPSPERTGEVFSTISGVENEPLY